MADKLVYDDDCRFCTWAVAYAVRRSDLAAVPFSAVRDGESDLTADELARLPDDYEECAHLIADDAVYSCGAAMERALVRTGALPTEAVDFLAHFEDYERLREAAYAFIADNRSLLSPLFREESPIREEKE